ncbi:unnamed protein product [Haemonchus placei]|uniref:Uncharacterized protein n=1 Tax=Haemonchus placei TaxID=6290 RepID=A0A0N4WRL3_HAEPC|nr:unnamed protein product [Haemonchus placei]
MQRLHCWLDQLTLRRSRRRESLNQRRNVSQSVAPSCRLNLESKSKKHTELRPVNVPMVMNAIGAIGAGGGGGGSAPMMARKPETGSFARRRLVQSPKVTPSRLVTKRHDYPINFECIVVVESRMGNVSGRFVDNSLSLGLYSESSRGF